MNEYKDFYKGFCGSDLVAVDEVQTGMDGFKIIV
jgi:hypothetical protein